MFKKIILCIACLAFAGGHVLYAQTAEQQEVLSAYQQYMEIGPFDIVVPTVVSLPIEERFLERYQFVVAEEGVSTFQPYYLEVTQTSSPALVSVATQTSTGNPRFMVDNDLDTYVDYDLPSDGRGVATITLTAQKPVTVSTMSLLLDRYVALPTSVEVIAIDGEEEKIVVAKKRMTGQTVSFLETTAQMWRIQLEYAQPLRINELRLVQNDVENTTERSIRFLAQPNTSYTVYMDPDRHVSVQTVESGDLTGDDDVLELNSVETKENPLYTKADVDQDGVPDSVDNCVREPNTDQQDIDNNGRGDVCDDHDRDGHINSKDNCQNEPNRDQKDTDGDGIGDVCDDEESRVTEKYAWLPWAGMGLVGLVIASLFVITIRGMKHDSSDSESEGRSEKPFKNEILDAQARLGDNE
jgi:hypothetical protein